MRMSTRGVTSSEVVPTLVALVRMREADWAAWEREVADLEPLVGLFP